MSARDIDAKAWARAVASEYDRRPLWLHLTDERTLALARAVLSAYLKAVDELATPTPGGRDGA